LASSGSRRESIEPRIVVCKPLIKRVLRRRIGFLTVILLGGLWVGALTAAPLPSRSSHGVRPWAAAAVYAAGAVVCHQRPQRSFHLAGAQLPVCARCLGLYVGGLLGAISWVVVAGAGAQRSGRAQRLLEPPVLRAILCACAIPTGLTVITAAAGVWDPSNVPRALLAVPIGIAVGALVCAVASRDLR
jgi:uncharacterized membrane protein